MNILGVNFSSDNNFKITDDDKLWVEENFRWLKEVFGYPNKLEEQVLITAKHFPVTFSTTFLAENVVTDLCKLFGIPRSAVRLQMVTDLRDAKNIPYQIEGIPFESESDLVKGAHTIFIANSLLANPERLIHSLIYEFIRIRLTESELEFQTQGDDNGLFIYLAGIYYGFGVILANNLENTERSSDGMWEIKWNYVSEMPMPVMAFSLATYANLRGENDPVWKHELKGDIKNFFESAIKFLVENPNNLYDATEVQANDLFNLANDQFEKGHLDDAIATLHKILFLTKDAHMKADVYNNIGYYYLRMKEYTQGISNFRKAISLGEEYGFANDNLGYALMMTGEVEEGVMYVRKAMATGSNDPAYSFRNLALYYQNKKQPVLAHEYFQKALAENVPVDLLEYHYGIFLLEEGDETQARFFFEKSAEKKEEEGIAQLRQLIANKI